MWSQAAENYANAGRRCACDENIAQNKGLEKMRSIENTHGRTKIKIKNSRIEF